MVMVVNVDLLGMVDMMDMVDVLDILNLVERVSIPALCVVDTPWSLIKPLWFVDQIPEPTYNILYTLVSILL